MKNQLLCSLILSCIIICNGCNDKNESSKTVNTHVTREKKPTRIFNCIDGTTGIDSELELSDSLGQLFFDFFVETYPRFMKTSQGEQSLIDSVQQDDKTWSYFSSTFNADLTSSIRVSKSIEFSCRNIASSSGETMSFHYDPTAKKYEIHYNKGTGLGEVIYDLSIREIIERFNYFKDCFASQIKRENINKEILNILAPQSITYVFEEKPLNGMSTYKILKDIELWKTAITNREQNAASLVSIKGFEAYYYERPYICSYLEDERSIALYCYSKVKDSYSNSNEVLVFTFDKKIGIPAFKCGSFISYHGEVLPKTRNCNFHDAIYTLQDLVTSLRFVRTQHR